MYLHLEFTNGSNPFIFYGQHPGETTRADCLAQLQKWRARFDVIELKEDSGKRTAAAFLPCCRRGGRHDSNNNNISI